MILHVVEVSGMKKGVYKDQWIVVTGAAGFIGSCILRRLNDIGLEDTVIAVDTLQKDERWRNLNGKKYSEFMHPSELLDWMQKEKASLGAVIHMGANSSTTGVDGDEYYFRNYRYSIDLATFCFEHDIRFIYASSAATYGNGEMGYEDDETRLDHLRPMNLYGMSKHMFDLWLSRNKLLDRAVGLKFFNVYGPNEQHKGRMSSMVKHMFHQIQDDGFVKLFASNDKRYEDGGQKRDFVYVKDVVDIVCDLLFEQTTGIYNVGSGIASTWNQLAAATFTAMNKSIDIRYISMPEDLHKSYQNYTCASMAKLSAKMTLPQSELEKNVADYVQNYLMVEETW